MSMTGSRSLNSLARVAATIILTVQMVLAQPITGSRLHQWVQEIEGKSRKADGNLFATN